MARLHLNSAAQELLRGGRPEWAHVYLAGGHSVPPTYAGSYNHLLWTVARARAPRDIVVCRFDATAWQLAESSECPVAMIEINDSPPPIRQFRSLKFRRIDGSHDRELRCAVADALKACNCSRILAWGGLHHLEHLRALLPDAKLVFSQQGYEDRRHAAQYACADVLVTLSPGAIRSANEHVGYLVPLAVSIPNGVDTDEFTPPTSDHRASARARFDLPQDAMVVVFPSKLAEYKGIRYVAEWIRHAERTATNVHFFVVGRLESSLPDRFARSLVELMSASPVATWLPGVPRADMATVYHAADVALVPSTGPEGFGLVAAEAMSSGLPVIATRAGALPEFVHHRATGLVVDRHHLLGDGWDAIQELRTDSELRAQLGANARAYAVARLGQSRYLSNYFALLEGRYLDIDAELSPEVSGARDSKLPRPS